MRTIFRRAWLAFQAARQRRADADSLEHLDEHALRDIGFEPEANFRREALNRAAMRLRML
jgi:hypothetical protein